MASASLLQIVLLTLLTKDVNAKTGLIKADLGNQESHSSNKGDVFCMDYHNNYAPMPLSYTGKTSIPVANYIFTQGCVDDDYKNIADKIVAIGSDICTYEEKAEIIQRLHGKAALIVMNENTSDILPIDSKYHNINITVVRMFFNDFVSLIALDSQVKIWFYAPEESYFDPSLILLLCPVTIIVLASWWSASVQNKKTSHDRRFFKVGKVNEDDEKKKGVVDTLTFINGNGGEKEYNNNKTEPILSFKEGKEGKEVNKEIEDHFKDGKVRKEENKKVEDSFLDGKDGKVLNKETEDSSKDGQVGENEVKKKEVDDKFVEEEKQKCQETNLVKKEEKNGLMKECFYWVFLIIWLVYTAAKLLFFIYMIVIALLLFVCSFFVYIMITIFSLLGAWGIFNACLFLWKKLLPCNERPVLRNLFLLLLGMSVVVAWFVVRNESSAWILQDIIGFFICIQIICTIHLANFKDCCIILFLFLVYDVCMVYSSPFCTNVGIMARANFSESQPSEKNPMIMILPYFTPRPLLECKNMQFYSGLGLMDIIIPGLVISHNCAFDLNIHNPLHGRCHFIYFISSIVAYVVGLLLAMTPAIIMGSIQPALLYIVPCIIPTTLIIASIRGQLGSIWRGVCKIDICHHVTSEMCEKWCSVLRIIISVCICKRKPID